MIARFWLKHPVMTRASCICISIFLLRPNSGLISIDCYHYWDYQQLSRPSQAILGPRCSLKTDSGRPALKGEKNVWTVNADWELEAEHTSLSIQIKVLIFAPRREAWTVVQIGSQTECQAPCLSPSSLTSTKVKVTPTSWFIEIIWEWPYKIEIKIERQNQTCGVK